MTIGLFKKGKKRSLFKADCSLGFHFHGKGVAASGGAAEDGAAEQPAAAPKPKLQPASVRSGIKSQQVR